MSLGYLILPEKRRGAPLPDVVVHDIAEIRERLEGGDGDLLENASLMALIHQGGRNA